MKIIQLSTFAIFSVRVGEATLFRGRNTNEPNCDDNSGLCSVNPRLNVTKLLQDFPTILDDDSMPKEIEIMCPILRLARRSGALPESMMDPHYSIPSIVSALSDNFGFSLRTRALAFGVATAMSSGQVATFSTYPGFVNLDRLYNVLAGSHASGFTFDGNSTTVSKEITQQTMRALSQLEDADGHLTFEDLQVVKVYAAESRDVSVSRVSGFEAGFVWTFCGGDERGYVETSDVERFLNGQLPLTVGQPSLKWWNPNDI